jgi:glycosyltransferase involved in cell wall biosynthesis
MLSTEQEGMPELICDGENGFWHVVKNPWAFISCLEQLIEDRALREWLGSAARKRLANVYTDFAISRISADYYVECVSTGCR